MKPYEKPLSPQEYLMHYGVKGMKWGVRRYQNYDGSYTRKGLERYRKAESDYETAKSKADETRAAYKSGQATRQQVKDAKSAVKTEKRKMENAYELGELKKLAGERMLLFDEELLTFSMGNCITMEDTNGNRKLLKKRSDQKIDAVAAMMDAYIAYKHNPEAFE